jgi:hypothetical protein
MAKAGPVKTAYARMMAEERKKERNKHRQWRTPRAAQLAGKCGAKRKDGRICLQHAGFGTTHKGIGRCKFHGGNMTPAIKHAAKQQAIFMGAPKDINPVDALMYCIRVTAGEVEWLSEQLAQMQNEDDWTEYTMAGKQMHVFQRARAEALIRLARFSKDAIALGIAERAVRIAEQYGFSIARLLKNVLEELKLSPEQKVAAPEIIRRNLILLEQGAFSGQPQVNHQKDSIMARPPEIPERVAS